MSKTNKIKIFLVDDDVVYLKMLEIEFLNQGDFILETYSTGKLCLQNLKNKPDVIILDYLLDGIDKTAWNGIDTLDKIKAINPEVPVIILSQQDKIEVAVECMHHKALDYVVKSETAFVRLQKIISDVMEFHKMKDKLGWYMERM